MSILKANKRVFQVLLLGLCFSLAACFGGVKNSGKVRGYEPPGRILMQKSFYQVGTLPGSWQRLNLKGAKSVAFYNESHGATLSTAAFCDQAFNDSPLKMLTRHLFPGLEDLEILHQESLKIDGRGALRTWVKASLDGVLMDLDLVVIKKDACLFDFFLIYPTALAVPAQRSVERDFEAFFKGFRFRGF